MFWLALVIALAAALCFLAVTLAAAHPRRSWVLPLGLMFLTIAWTLQVVWEKTSGRISIK